MRPGAPPFSLQAAPPRDIYARRAFAVHAMRFHELSIERYAAL